MHMVVVAYETLNRRFRNIFQRLHTQTMIREARDRRTFSNIMHDMDAETTSCQSDDLEIPF